MMFDPVQNSPREVKVPTPIISLDYSGAKPFSQKNKNRTPPIRRITHIA